MNELLVPRQKIAFTPIQEGRFIPLSSDIPDALTQPMVRSKNGTVAGYESGYRSGLIHVNSQLYKLKGCRPEGGEWGNEPKGSQTLSLAQFEADRVLERRARFLEEGYEYPLEPIGFWAYDHIVYNGEPNAATIYKALGDTRLDEFLWWIERTPFQYLPAEHRENMTNSLLRIGYQIGKALNVFHQGNFTWDSDIETPHLNAHAGNIVLFPGARKATGVAVIDFDNSINFTPQDPDEETDMMKLVQVADFIRLRNGIDNLAVVSKPRRVVSPFPYASDYIVDRLFTKALPDLPMEDMGAAGACLLKILNPRVRPEDVPSLRAEILHGLPNGYKAIDLNQEDIFWNELKVLANSVVRHRRNFIRDARAAAGDLTYHRAKELAEIWNGNMLNRGLA